MNRRDLWLVTGDRWRFTVLSCRLLVSEGEGRGASKDTELDWSRGGGHPRGIFVRADSKGVTDGVSVRAESKGLTEA